MSRVININSCRNCGGLATFSLNIRPYGFCGCEIKCLLCERKVRNTGITEMHIDWQGKLYTPTTDESLMKCIIKTISTWNEQKGDSV